MSYLRSIRNGLLLIALLISGRDLLAESGELPPNPIARLEIREPARLLSLPVIEKLKKTLSESALVSEIANIPEYDRGYEVLRGLVESNAFEAGDGWQRVFSGGVQAGLYLGAGPEAISVITAESEEIAQKFVSGVRAWVEGEVKKRGGGSPFIEGEYKGYKITSIGDLHYLLDGKHIVLGSRGSALERYLSKGNNEQSTDRFRSLPTVSEPGIRLEFDIQRLREIGQWKIPSLPGNDGGVILLAGWVEMLGRAELGWIDLRAFEDGLELSVNFQSSRAKVPEELSGYFGGSEHTKLAPLLMPPGTIFSSSSYRDLRQMWHSRSKLLQGGALSGLEKAHTELKKFNQGIGYEEIADLLGARIRFVSAHQQSNPYAVVPADRLPGFAMVVELRDGKKFEEKVVPGLKSIVTIIALISKVNLKNVEYMGAKLNEVRFPDDELSASTGDQIRFNFDPTYCVSQNHFIASSTSELARYVIDQLPQEKPVESASLDMQYFSFAELAGMIERLRPLLIRRAALEAGLSSDDANREFDVFVKAIQGLGKLEYGGTWEGDHFQYKLLFSPL